MVFFARFVMSTSPIIVPSVSIESFFTAQYSQGTKSLEILFTIGFPLESLASAVMFYSSESGRGTVYNAIHMAHSHGQLVSDKVVVIQRVYSSLSRFVRTSGSLGEIVEEDWLGHSAKLEEIMGSSF